MRWSWHNEDDWRFKPRSFWWSQNQTQDLIGQVCDWPCGDQHWTIEYSNRQGSQIRIKSTSVPGMQDELGRLFTHRAHRHTFHMSKLADWRIAWTQSEERPHGPTLTALKLSYSYVHRLLISTIIIYQKMRSCLKEVKEDAEERYTILLICMYIYNIID
jgi:hypothetical protein